MQEETPLDTGGLSSLYQHYERQKCFIGLSHGARWREEIVSTCDEVLPSPGFDLEPWYADHYYDPTKPLLDIVVEMIANARYGIYDLSYWRKEGEREWIMPRNVFIELGIAIALNRPTLLLQHEESRQEGPKLPECLEGVRDRILPFAGNYSLEKALKDRLPQWVNVPPEQEWQNRYCHFGDRRCLHREAHPRARHWMHGPLPCLISHGSDRDQRDFRATIERVLRNYNDVQASYLNELAPSEGYEFLHCTYCQKVRSTPFTIHRITPETPAEAFMAIGISIALEAQFNYKIPKILLAARMEDVPSLLAGHKVVLAKDDLERKKRLQEFLPMVYQAVRTTTWRSRPLPFIEVMPRQSEKPFVSQKQRGELAVEDASSYNEQGNTFYQAERYEEALAAYEQTIQLAPQIAHYHYSKGLALHNLNRYQEALTAYEHAIQIAPDYAAVYGGRGSTYAVLKQYQEALQSFDRALALDPTLDWVKAQREEVTRLLTSDVTVAPVNPQTSSYPDAKEGNTQFPVLGSLKFLTGPLAGTTYPIIKHTINLGRDPANDIAIPDPTVSRHHAQILLIGDVWVIKKIAAQNKVILNQQEIVEFSLSDRDTVGLGPNTTFLFEAAVKGRFEPNAPRGSYGLAQEMQTIPPTMSAFEPSMNNPAGVPSLEVSTSTDHVRQVYPLSSNKQVFNIGRDPDNDIVIDRPTVSAFHAQIVREDNQLILIHPHPKRGRTVNGIDYKGRTIAGNESFRHLLVRGDVFRIQVENGIFVTLTYNDGSSRS